MLSWIIGAIVLAIIIGAIANFIDEMQHGPKQVIGSCELDQDAQGVYFKYGKGDDLVRPNTDTTFRKGDRVVTIHHRDTSICTVKSRDGAIKEEWHIQT
jgi:hypothetical protein